MRYLELDVGAWPTGELPWWGRALQAVLPAANPDLEVLYPKASRWWVEVSDTGDPLREIGFDDNGAPVVLGPIGRNYGFLVDGPIDWHQSAFDSAEAAGHFESRWNELWPSFKHLAS